MAYACDVTLHFKDQPTRHVFIGLDRKARDKKHAILLATMDVQAKGWDIRKLTEVSVTGPYLM